jgi:hypothetical protein
MLYTHPLAAAEGWLVHDPFEDTDMLLRKAPPCAHLDLVMSASYYSTPRLDESSHFCGGAFFVSVKNLGSA